jgi:hypothetical protein
VWNFMPSIKWAVPQECVDNLKEDAWKVGREEGTGGRSREKRDCLIFSLKC